MRNQTSYFLKYRMIMFHSFPNNSPEQPRKEKNATQTRAHPRTPAHTRARQKTSAINKDVEYNGVCGRISHLARARAPDADSEGCWDAGSSARVHRLQLLPPVDQTQGSTKIHRDVQGLVDSSSSPLVSLVKNE